MTMILIHIIHRLIKLSTLKHSWNRAHFTLKHSCLYAETLLRSIYTCIYLYKSTCSYQPQEVNNFFVKKLPNEKRANIALLMLLGCFLAGCQKTVYVCNQPINKIRVTENSATATHPAQFYLCGSAKYPCSVRSYAPRHHPISFHHQQKKESLCKING